MSLLIDKQQVFAEIALLISAINEKAIVPLKMLSQAEIDKADLHQLLDYRKRLEKLARTIGCIRE